MPGGGHIAGHQPATGGGLHLSAGQWRRRPRSETAVELMVEFGVLGVSIALVAFVSRDAAHEAANTHRKDCGSMRMRGSLAASASALCADGDNYDDVNYCRHEQRLSPRPYRQERPLRPPRPAESASGDVAGPALCRQCSGTRLARAKLAVPVS